MLLLVRCDFCRKLFLFQLLVAYPQYDRCRSIDHRNYCNAVIDPVCDLFICSSKEWVTVTVIRFPAHFIKIKPEQSAYRPITASIAKTIAILLKSPDTSLVLLSIGYFPGSFAYNPPYMRFHITYKIGADAKAIIPPR